MTENASASPVVQGGVSELRKLTAELETLIECWDDAAALKAHRIDKRRWPGARGELEDLLHSVSR